MRAIAYLWLSIETFEKFNSVMHSDQLEKIYFWIVSWCVFSQFVVKTRSFPKSRSITDWRMWFKDVFIEQQRWKYQFWRFSVVETMMSETIEIFLKCTDEERKDREILIWYINDLRLSDQFLMKKAIRGHFQDDSAQMTLLRRMSLVIWNNFDCYSATFQKKNGLSFPIIDRPDIQTKMWIKWN